MLNECTALVTGAGRGIGRAIAERLASEGARVGLLSRTEQQLEEVAVGIAQVGGHAIVLPADVTDHGQVESAVATLTEACGPVDLLVNNAGSFYAVGPLWETDPDAWWRDVHINIRGVAHGCRAVIPAMLERGSGRIVNLIGGGTGNAFPYGSGYATSKAGVMRFTECIAAELADTPVKVFAMDPGLVRTRLTEFQLTSDEGKRWMARIGQRFDEGADLPPTRAAGLAAEIATGRFDALAGRALSAGEDLDAIASSAGAALANDLRTLRMR